MLAKLLKYEIPALGRKLMPLYIGWMAAALLAGAAVNDAVAKSNYLIGISVLLYTAAGTAVVVMTAVMIIQRFSRELLGDGGYFSHTLPVTVSQQIGGKTIGAMLWMIVSFFVFIITFVIMATMGAGFGWIGELTKQLSHLKFGDWAEFFKLLLLWLIETVKSILGIYAALAIGHQAHRHTVLVSIGAYIGLLFLSSTVNSLLSHLMNIFIPVSDSSYQLIGDMITANFPTMLISGLLMGVLYFFITKELLEKRLNLT